MGNFARTRLARTTDVVDVVADVAAPAALTSSNQGGNFADLAAATAAYNLLRNDVVALRTTVADLRTALQTEA
jgi:hypothetical protein